MQQVWRNRWRQSGWIALGASTLVLLGAAISHKNHKVCSGIEVTINGDGNNYFIDEKSIKADLTATQTIEGEPIESINLKSLEGRLKNVKWIADADLYFDSKQVLQVEVKEKEPVARIFTTAGTSFYIDSACKKLPLSDKLSARIPMFTSFPSDRNRLSKPDSALLASVKELAMFIQADEFWKAQVAQVDITPDGFEMIPTIGNHVVELGKENNWQQKFDRLYSFYKQVWMKVGFERYEKIDVQYNGQVVATLKGAKAATVDTAKARMAFENLIESTKKSIDTISTSPPVVTNNSNQVQAGAVKSVANKVVVSQQQQQVITPASNAVKNNKAIAVKPAGKQIPKAVMKKQQ